MSGALSWLLVFVLVIIISTLTIIIIPGTQDTFWIKGCLESQVHTCETYEIRAFYHLQVSGLFIDKKWFIIMPASLDGGRFDGNTDILSYLSVTVLRCELSLTHCSDVCSCSHHQALDLPVLSHLYTILL